MDIFLWMIVPYVCLAVFVLGHVWRYRYDQFGWTTRSSQMYEDRILRWAGPMFHFGILAVVVGHAMGLLIPMAWTEALGISQEFYHFLAVFVGGIAGIFTVVGLALLIIRRRSNKRIMGSTTVMDKIMYAMLSLVILSGVGNTLGGLFSHYNYREGVSPWFRGVFSFSPDPAYMAEAPFGFQLHAMAAMLLFALWPFTRLVHVFSAPVGYLFRPYIVYRSRDDKPRTPSRAGW
ncbi:MAG: respiratory nitrate reductase subunit gamma [Brachybacterium sp.]|nr:respiratory nitrate reductase subunit gamma [Brachybacterium sp.]